MKKIIVLLLSLIISITSVKAVVQSEFIDEKDKVCTAIDVQQVELDKNLVYAAFHRFSLDKIEDLIEKGASVNASNDNGLTILMVAALENNESLARFLIKRGANIHLKCKHGENALIIAAATGGFDVARLLLEHGAIINDVNSLNITAFHAAAIRGHKKILEFLLENGASDYINDVNNMTPLMNASDNCHIDVVMFLIKNGALVNAKKNHGDTALMYAVKCGDLALLQLLLDKGASIDDSTIEGITPLLFALNNEKLSVAEFLFDKKANINVQETSYGWTPLLLAVEKGYVDFAEQLIKAGVDIYKKNNEGFDAFLLSAAEGKIPFLEMFINDFNMDINKIGTRGVTALYVAVVNQRYDAVQFLIDHGADVNIPNDEGATPLMQAAFFIHDIKMLKLLIDHGARVNEVGNKKVSALQIATRGGYEEIIAFLLAKQANPNLADKNGFTALMEAVNNKNTAICALLLKAGADCTLKNNKGYTALEMANYYGFQEISNLLKQIAK